MSTRAIISIFDKLDGFNIYIHWGGWPELIIASIEKATEFAWKLPRFQAGEFATALIRVLKIRAWWVYLISATEKIFEVDYLYQIYEENWDLKIKTTDNNPEHFW